MSMKKSFKDLMKTNKMILLPETYDFASTRCVELCGFEAAIISSTEFALATNGDMDLGLITIDEAVWLCERVCRAAQIPIIMDAEGGFGRPLNTYKAARRLAACGVGGIIVTDESATYLSYRDPERGAAPQKEAIARMRAAAAGLEESEAILVARTDVDMRRDFDEVVERCNKYIEAGATTTMVLSLNEYRDADERMDAVRRLAAQVPGSKWYPDLGSKNGKSDVSLDEIAELGFNMVGIHYLLLAATYGMVEAGRHIAQERNNLVLERNMKAMPEAAAVMKGTIPKAAFLDSFGLTDGTWSALERKFFEEDHMFASKSHRIENMMRGIREV